MTAQDNSLQRARELVARSIDEYSGKRLAYYTRRRGLLKDLLKKDPLLAALRGVTTASGWLDEAFNAHESSSEETMMGSAWQQILTDLSSHSVGAGDFLFEKEDMLWVLEMKSQTNTLNAPALAQTLKVLKQRVLDHSGIRTPRRRGVSAMIGVLRGDALDLWRTFSARSAENRDINGFQYRYMVGAPFRAWLTGLTHPSELVEASSEQGASLLSARNDCRQRLQRELDVLLREKGLPDDIQSVMRLSSEQREP